MKDGCAASGSKCRICSIRTRETSPLCDIPRRTARRPPAMSRRLSAGLVLLFCGVLLWYGLTGPLYRTEGLRALVAAEMLRRGDVVVPTCCGEPLLTKPPLGYVAVVAASLPAGSVRPWTARL